MYLLGLLVGFLLVYLFAFAIFAVFVWLICSLLAIKFVLRYVIAAYLIGLLIRWIWKTK